MSNRVIPPSFAVRSFAGYYRAGLAALLPVLAALLMLASATPVHAQGEDDAGLPVAPAGAVDTRTFLPLVSIVDRPTNPWPSNWMDTVSANTWLEWQFSSPSFPEPNFAVYLGTTPSPATRLAADLTETHLALATLTPGWRYYWQVVATSSNGRSIAGPVWTFLTEAPTTEPNVGVMIPIPEGEFQMGCDPQRDGEYLCRDRESPLHPIWLDGYEIDKYEVTNREYRACVAAGECRPPRFGESLTRPDYYTNPTYDLFPVLYVSRWDAIDYCTFADKRIPTEAEWEKAARGPIDTRPWPWGDGMITCEQANFTDTRDESDWEICVGDTTQVGSYPLGASPYGVMDVSGNVFEWVYDNWDINFYKVSPYMNPTGPNWTQNPADGPAFGIRGGSYRPRWFYPRTFNRHYGHHGHEGVGMDAPFYRNNQVGFRCAR